MVHGTHNAIQDDRNDSILININGKLFPRKDAKISVFDSAFLVGDGVWEAFRLHNGKLVFYDEHLQRLQQGLKTIGLELHIDFKTLSDRIQETIDANNMENDTHVRVMISRGNKKTPSQDPRLTIGDPNIIIIAEHKKASAESKNRGISLFTSSIRRGSPDYLDPKLNCHSKLHEVLALNQAIAAGADEALMLDINGFVSTCNATNFFIVKNNEVWTSTGAYCMNGITRAKVIEICRENNIPCHTKNFSLFDVYGAHEAFVTGTFGGLTPVYAVDGNAIPSKSELTNRISKIYQDKVNSFNNP